MTSPENTQKTFSLKAKPLLIEIGTEELPPKAITSLSEAFKKNITEQLNVYRIHHGEVQIFSTPRRLALLIQDVKSDSEALSFLKKGPAVSASFDPNNNQPSKALLGFLNSVGLTIDQLDQLDQLSKEDSDKGAYFIFQGIQPGQPIKNLLPKIIQTSLEKLPLPKAMRWGSHMFSFARPIQWIILLHGTELIPAEIFNLQTNILSQGHRFHHPDPVTIQSAQTYESQMEAAHVIVNSQKRKQIIQIQVEALAKSLNAEAILPEILLDEITQITEWPVALACEFDPDFLNTPPEALISALQVHQKAVALKTKQQNKIHIQTLLPKFIIIANLNSKNPEAVILGNQKVVRARLSDASFFYQTDLKQNPLDSDEKKQTLSKLTYQAKLGSMKNRQDRIQQLVQWISNQDLKLNLNLDLLKKLALRASELSKLDLITQMVMEFPELQGIMGDYYARAMGEPIEVSTAIREQYLPKYAGDELPATPTGIILAIADKIDALVGIFGIGEKPTGSKDPFGLRRQAIGLLRILTEKKLDVSLSTLIQASIKIHAGLIENSEAADKTQKELQKELKEFILERLKNHWLEAYSIHPSLFEAVKSAESENLSDMTDRLEALQTFLSNPAVKSLISANKRINNFLSKNNTTQIIKISVDINLFSNTEEKNLWAAFSGCQKNIELAWTHKNYTNYLNQLADLKNPIDQFFENVMVLCEDIQVQNNRLALLAQINQIFKKVADFSLISE